MSVYTQIAGGYDDTIVETDSDGYGPPQYGGTVNCRYNTVYYYHEDDKAYLFTLPAGAEIVGWSVNVVTAFNGGTDVMDIGDYDTANKYADDLDITSAGQIVTGFDDDEMFAELSSETQFFASPSSGGTQSAGQANVAVFFIIR